MQCELECTTLRSGSCIHAQCQFNLIGQRFLLYIAYVTFQPRRGSDAPGSFSLLTHGMREALVTEDYATTRFKHDKIRGGYTPNYTHQVNVRDVGNMNDVRFTNRVNNDYVPQNTVLKALIIKIMLKSDPNEPTFFNHKPKTFLTEEGIIVKRDGK